VQTSSAVSYMVYVPGSPVKFCSQYALYPLAFEEFSDQKRSGFELSVAQSIGVPVSSVAIHNAEAGTSLDTTIVTYCVSVTASPVAATTGTRLAAVKANVGGVTKSTNGTLHTALVRNQVLASGGGPSAQATGPSTGVIPGLGSDSALYAALIVACIVLLCCIIGACCWWRNREKRYRRVSHHKGGLAVLPETPPETPTSSNTGGPLEADPEPEQDELTSAPLTKRTSNSMRTGAPRAPLAGVPTPLSATPEPTLVQPKDYAKSGVIDLSEYMREAEDISTTIEKKGTPLFQVRPPQRASRR